MKDEKGYYFYIEGNTWNRSIEAAIFIGQFIGLVIRLQFVMAARFLGGDCIGIVPVGVIPSYCESYFHKEKILDFIKVDKGDGEKLLEYIIWQDISEQNLI
jgi:hypothetical protein